MRQVGVAYINGEKTPVQSVSLAHWDRLFYRNGEEFTACSECRFPTDNPYAYRWRFCPHCGARMESYGFKTPNPNTLPAEEMARRVQTDNVPYVIKGGGKEEGDAKRWVRFNDKQPTWARAYVVRFDNSVWITAEKKHKGWTEAKWDGKQFWTVDGKKNLTPWVVEWMDVTNARNGGRKKK